MNQYDGKIKLSTLNSNMIKKINEIQMKNPNQKLYIEIPNTRGISSKMLRQLASNAVRASVPNKAQLRSNEVQLIE